MYTIKYAFGMSPRTGRPRTGVKPNFGVRVDKAVADMARDAARSSGKRVGVWLEEAIRDKLEREQKGERGNDS